MEVYLIRIKYYHSALMICWWAHPVNTNSYITLLLYSQMRMYKKSQKKVKYGRIRSNQVDEQFILSHATESPLHYLFPIFFTRDHFYTIMKGLHASKGFFRTFHFYQFRPYWVMLLEPDVCECHVRSFRWNCQKSATECFIVPLVYQ